MAVILEAIWNGNILKSIPSLSKYLNLKEIFQALIKNCKGTELSISVLPHPTSTGIQPGNVIKELEEYLRLTGRIIYSRNTNIMILFQLKIKGPATFITGSRLSFRSGGNLH